MVRFTFLLTFLFSFSTVAESNPAVRVADINQEPATVADSSPTPFVELNGMVYFAGTTEEFGRELWRTDGTLAGTELVKDSYLGATGWNFKQMTVFNQQVVYLAARLNNFDLWASDGTEAGTNILIGTPTNITEYVEFDGELYFAANRFGWGHELMKTDGTISGTVHVLDIYPGHLSSNPHELTVSGGRLFFLATDPSNGTELWQTDGTAGGTLLVKDIFPGAGGSTASHLTDLNGTLLFIANDSISGRELWKSDGSPTGTSLVSDIAPGVADGAAGFFETLLPAGGTLLLIGSPSGSPELWSTDGTPSGTLGISLQTPSRPGVSVSGLAFFPAIDTAGEELWVSDGTSSGTTRLQDINPGLMDSSPEHLTSVQGQLFFTAEEVGSGRELYRSDGTPAGTVQVADIAPGPGGSDIGFISTFGSSVILSADDGTHGLEPWISDGTTLGTAMIEDVAPGGDSSEPGNVLATVGHIYFSATNEFFGEELWRSDGTGANLVKNLAPGDSPGNASSSPRDLIDYNGSLLFIAADGPDIDDVWRADELVTTVLSTGLNPVGPGLHLSELEEYQGLAYFGILGVFPPTAAGQLIVNGLARTDGTVVGTEIVASPLVPSRDPILKELTTAGTHLYFSGDGTSGSNDSGFAPYRSDGTEPGTVWIGPFGDLSCGFGTAGSHPKEFTAAAGTVFFVADSTWDQCIPPTEPTRGELWKDLAGTGTLVKEIRTIDSEPSSPRDLVDFLGQLYFSADDGVIGRELWTSNGTDVGTVLAVDINAGPSGSELADIVKFNGALYFAATDSAGDRELWVSDGLPVGTQRVIDIQPGPIGSNPSALAVVGDNFYFVADDGSNGRELWISDGTAPGTYRVSNVTAGVEDPQIQAISSVNDGDRVMFLADDGVHGLEPWESDGTLAGTRMMQDIWVGPMSGGTPLTEFVGSGDWVYFQAADGVTGTELWATQRYSSGTIAPATPLQVSLSGTDVVLDWGGSSCPGATADYAVYEGVLGSFASHTELQCSTGSLTTATLTPGGGDRYYLVVPTGVSTEGSYGKDSNGVERPQGQVSCLPQLVGLSCVP